MARPPLYKPEYCNEVIEMGKEGLSVVAMACRLDVHRSVLYDWVDAYPEWAHAFEMARQHSQAYWERVGEAGLSTKYFNATVWTKIVGARFSDYQDRTKVEHTGPDGGPIQTAVTINYNPVRASND